MVTSSSFILCAEVERERRDHQFQKKEFARQYPCRPKNIVYTISHFVGETLIIRGESKIKDTPGVVANRENGSQRDSNRPATRSYRAVKSPSPNLETLQDSD